MSNEQKIFALTRPHPRLMKLYTIQAILSGPFIVIAFPLLYFRYHTMRYQFDDEGVSMQWGVLFRKEVNLTYRRIQDIHVTSGPIMRWMGLADLQIQTASGSASAEMTIEGFPNFEEIRDFLYSKMRGAKGEKEAAVETASVAAPPPETSGAPTSAGNDAVVSILRDIGADLKAANAALARLETGREGDHV